MALGGNTINNSGKATTLAKDFEAKYGIKVNGTKADSATQIQQVTREVQPGNVKLGVLSSEDDAMLQGQLILTQSDGDTASAAGCGERS